MALTVTLSKIIPVGHVMTVQPVLAGTSTLDVAVSGVKRDITLVLAGS